MNVHSELNRMSHKQCVIYAVKRAESVIHLITNTEDKARAERCVKTASAWVLDPSDSSSQACRTAVFSYGLPDDIYNALHSAISAGIACHSTDPRVFRTAVAGASDSADMALAQSGNAELISEIKGMKK